MNSERQRDPGTGRLRDLMLEIAQPGFCVSELGLETGLGDLEPVSAWYHIASQCQAWCLFSGLKTCHVRESRSPRARSLVFPR